jgi:hypothetical protein
MRRLSANLVMLAMRFGYERTIRVQASLVMRGDHAGRAIDSYNFCR